MPNDSLVFRIKYAYAQFNLDDWMTRGSWARLGIQQTPWVDFEEGIYRYRFQGTVFAERIPLPTTMTSSDAGVSFHYNLPSNYGDIHVGVYNGENYQRVELNDQKALEFRGTLRPFAHEPAGAARASRRISSTTTITTPATTSASALMGNVTFEHQYVNAGFDYLDAKDQTLATATDVESHGYSIWATPRLPLARRLVVGSAAALRPLDAEHARPRSAPASTSPDARRHAFNDQNQNRTIAGVAYWFPHQGNVSTAHPGRLRRPEFRQHHHRADARASRCTGCSISSEEDI